MAQIQPFAAVRYAPEKVGRLENVITQPYDKITPEMLERYLALSPYNLARVIKNTDYAGAAAHLSSWLREGVLQADPRPAIYPYFQQYRVPGSGESQGEVVTRKGFIAAVRLEDYENRVVFRHEQTLAGPKKDRLELLRATRIHFGQLFMLYSDPSGELDSLLDRAAAQAPVECVTDEYDAAHRVWRVDDPAGIAPFVRAMADKKLVIADGHHRYETALAFRDECRRSAAHREGGACEYVMMTLVNMEAPGLTILPTHRLLAHFPNFDRARFLEAAARYFETTPMTPAECRAALSTHGPGEAIGVAMAREGGGADSVLLRLRPAVDLVAELPRYMPEQRRLDVVILHELLLNKCLGITEQDVREEKHLKYVREFEKGVKAVEEGAPACFFLNAIRAGQMRDVAFAGGVMPQKSTDFYPKLLSGLAGYRVVD